MNLLEALNIPRGVTAAIGSGGKTTLLFSLYKQLAKQGASVVLCTSTHILPFGAGEIPCVTGGERALAAALKKYGAACAGTQERESGKLTQSKIPFSRMAELADYVLVEADGARGKPLKAHAAYEPVVPQCAARVVYVLGADGIGQSIREAAHRPALYAAGLGVSQAHLVAPEDALRMLDFPGAVLLVNKADAQYAAAQAVAKGYPGRAAVGSVASELQVFELWEDGKCLYRASKIKSQCF